MKNPGGVGEKRELSKGDSGNQQYLPALRVLWTGQSQQDSEESSNNTSGGCLCFTGIFKSVYGMILWNGCAGSSLGELCHY